MVLIIQLAVVSHTQQTTQRGRTVKRVRLKQRNINPSTAQSSHSDTSFARTRVASNTTGSPPASHLSPILVRRVDVAKHPCVARSRKKERTKAKSSSRVHRARVGFSNGSMWRRHPKQALLVPVHLHVLLLLLSHWKDTPRTSAIGRSAKISNACSQSTLPCWWRTVAGHTTHSKSRECGRFPTRSAQRRASHTPSLRSQLL